MDGLGQKALRRHRQHRLFDRGRRPVLSFEHLPELFDFGRDGLLEFRADMIEKRLVLRLRPRQPDLDMRRPGLLLQKRVGHDHLGGVGHRQQRRNRKVVERTPVQNLLDDGVRTVHAVIDGPDPAPAAL